MSANLDSIFSIRHAVKSIVTDVKEKAKEAIELYDQSLMQLPDLRELKNIDKFHVVFKHYSDAQDALVRCSTRVDLVLVQIKEVQKEKLGRDATNDYRELAGFKKDLSGYVEDLEIYKQSLQEVRRANNDKIKILQSLMYQNIVG